VRDALRMAADIAWPEDINFFANSHFDFPLYDVGERFVRMNVQRSADTRLIMDLEQGHLVRQTAEISERKRAKVRIKLLWREV